MKSTTVFNSSFYFLFLFSSIFVSWSTFLLSHRVVVAYSLNSEREALLSLLNRFTNVSDSIKSSWNDLSNSSTSPCHWSGITCNTENTHIVFLRLPSSGISGQLGPEIGRLRYLKIIDLSDNKLSGSIPTELWNCSDLQFLGLSLNDFTGELSEAVRNLQQLVHVFISHNHLSGMIPEFQVSGILDLSHNNLSGTIPFNIGNSTNIMGLSLDNNQLHGNIPNSLVNCTKLMFLNLGKNGLKGEIPLGVWRIPTLALIDVGNNNLSGELRVEMTELYQLNFIDLSDNQFSGLIPEALGINNSLMNHVDFSNNTFSGKIPPDLCFGKQLRMMHLDLNQLHGSIPPSYTRKCHPLIQLNLGENKLTGPLPDFERNSSLTMLDISGNNIHGKIPSSICNLLSSLEFIDLSENSMNGKLLHCLADHSLLYTLNLRNNDFSGTIPPNFTCNFLLSLDLNGNRFEGKIPRSFIHSPKLRYLDLGNNLLNDTFPFFLETLSDLQILVLRSNKFYGPLTSLVFNKLKVLDISNNYFTGDLPSEFILGLNSMKHVDPNYDILDKTIRYYQISTVVIHKGKEMTLNRTLMTTFRAIDVSENRFEGTIPESIGELVLLHMVNLSYNNFKSCIPSSLGNLKPLESLDLSENKLFGEIPWQLTNLNFLADLNLSYNNLKGRIPNGGQFLTFPNTSFHGNPELCGEQLSRKCGGDDADREVDQNPTEVKEIYEDSNSWNFDWEPVVIGYGCGIVIGLVIQYFVLTKAFLYRWFG